MKTRSVTFSYGTVKNASLLIPAEAYSVVDVVHLIRQSYLAYAFRPGCGLMSDECVTSSIGQANFFAGALGGWETRVSAEVFKRIKDYAECMSAMAMAVAQYREPNASPKAHYLRASKNEVLSQSERAFMAEMANHVKA